ncbi:hypothetical protein K1719_002452 [Acacia pycnantha]|nr:hypothetical protein K1719_002452 [Acacia pycnantha]
MYDHVHALSRSSHYWKHSTKGFHSSTSFKCGAVEACRDGILWNNKKWVKQTSWKVLPLSRELKDSTQKLQNIDFLKFI